MSKGTLEKLQDKMSYVHFFAGILHDNEKIKLKKEYPITENDFVDKFHKIIYAAFYNLSKDGVKKITPLEIVTYLNTYPTQKAIFDSNQGEEYLERLEEMGIPENFEYHFNRIKKFTLLRHYYNQGFDFSEIYSLDPFLSPEQEIINNKVFNEITLEQMIKHIDSKMISIKDEFIFDSEGYEGHISENILEMLEEKQQAPTYGGSFNSGFYNTATRGARKRKLYCRSGSSGSGKTRSGLADTLGMCVPYIYDLQKKMWVKTGATGRGLFISSELEEDEIKIPAICYIAGVDEEKINENTLFEDERERLKVALKILEKTPFWMVELFDFDTEDIEHVIEKYVNQYDVDYVFFDYIHSTLKMFEMMSKKGAKNLREDQLLRIMTIHLKNMCNRLDVHIDTSTQLSESWKGNGAEGYDQGALEGSKSIVNKLDLGCIQLPLTTEDEQLFEELKSSLQLPFGVEPTHTINIYKNRGNRWKKIRIWVHFDLGTLRTTDLFVTDYKGRPVKMNPKKIKFIKADIDKELSDSELLEELKSIKKAEKSINIKPEVQVDEKEIIILQEELKQTYEEIFEEDELPESIQEEIKGFGISKTDEQKRKEATAKALADW